MVAGRQTLGAKVAIRPAHRFFQRGRVKRQVAGRIKCCVKLAVQVGSGSFLETILAAMSVLMVGTSIFGVVMVTGRMLAMFQKS